MELGLFVYFQGDNWVGKKLQCLSWGSAAPHTEKKRVSKLLKPIKEDTKPVPKEKTDNLTLH